MSLIRVISGLGYVEWHGGSVGAMMWGSWFGMLACVVWVQCMALIVCSAVGSFVVEMCVLCSLAMRFDCCML